MAEIASLATTSTVAAGDYLAISQSGTTKKVTAANLGLVGAARIKPKDITAPGVTVSVGSPRPLTDWTALIMGIALVIDATGGAMAIFAIKGGANATQEMLDPSNQFSASSGTGSSINICYTGGRYEVQNNMAQARDVYVLMIGAG